MECRVGYKTKQNTLTTCININYKTMYIDCNIKKQRIACTDDKYKELKQIFFDKLLKRQPRDGIGN